MKLKPTVKKKIRHYTLNHSTLNDLGIKGRIKYVKFNNAKCGYGYDDIITISTEEEID